ncbi:DUF4198 domain-containing protein [Marivita hallyeonensis]|uniref:Uncharacterized conserved protein, contains GH25 family domain n=1 Tax=Marivita hallyeonensis TaxID=996342 RepID=A0A1M5XZH7_9RHOB|nr:DUF4198 domain-containing protein [Marivita hallyeonensis]SHI04948.1 Uncharacterized conserved protein, contains GH25 family domain [Marivita hallyeonensis]
MTYLGWITAACVALTPLMASAHEFWIEPRAYQVDPGGSIVATLRIGEEFGGAEQAYLPRSFARFEMRCAGSKAGVPGRAGDRPALAVKAPADGLCVAIHQTQSYSLTYQEWQKFLNFVDHKDFATAVADHKARGLPETGFTERYSRYAKSLIAVGSGQGKDRAEGLATEIVAEANPYTDNVSGGMPVRVLYNGKPRANAQVELFAKSPGGSVKITLHRTDRQGRVRLPVRAGYSYLADAVVLRPLKPAKDGDPVWETLWASLTFAVPR